MNWIGFIFSWGCSFIFIATVAILRWRDKKKFHALLVSTNAMVFEDKKKLKQQFEQLKQLRELVALHMDKNLEFERQRNQVWDMYRTAGVQAGNAQQLLMRELQEALRVLNHYRAKAGETPIEAPKMLHSVMEDFNKAHGAGRSDRLEGL